MRRFALVLLISAALSCKSSPPVVDAGVSRSVEVIRRDGNHLVGSSSRYLADYAHDPIDWYPWGEEAFARAQRENKPVFLSVGYIACHWCKVMHDEVFVKDEVARVLNDKFVSIKVDREEQPDVDRTYMAALDAFTESPGWPATLFLLPTREPFYGATYLPEAKFIDVATRSAAAFAAQPADMKKDAAELVRSLAPAPNAPAAVLGADELRAASTAALGSVDLARGGFKGGTKFPLPQRWTFLLHAYRKWGDAALASALQTTLAAMADGALRDPVSGAFHRYTTDPGWKTPHYEVMLYDNALLAGLYLEASAALAEPKWNTVATETLDFLVDDMTTADGAFAASFAADTGDVEGAAWTWSKAELVALLGDKDGPVVAALLGVDGKQAPRLRNNDDPTWRAARPKLRKARAGVAVRDDKVVAAWNGLAVTALARGAAATENLRWRDAALRAGETVWRRAHADDAAHLERVAGIAASLDDYACLAEAALALFELGADVHWLTRATALAQEAVTRFEAPEGGFFAGAAPPPFPRTVPLEDGAEPSGNGTLLRVLDRLSRLDASPEKWREPKRRAFAGKADALRRRGAVMGAWLDAALVDTGPFYELVVAGDMAVPDLRAPWMTSLRVPETGALPGLATHVPSVADKTAPPGKSRAFVCEDGACQSPTSDPEVLRKLLRAGWSR